MKAIKRISVTLAILILSTAVFGQSKIWIDGTIYCESDSTQKVIPFATVKLYSDSLLNELSYYAVCGPYGNFSIKPYNYNKDYYIIVEASGFSPRKARIVAIPEVLDNKPFSGNASINICLTSLHPIIQYQTSFLSKKEIHAKKSTLYNILLSINDIHCDSEGWYTTEGKGILFCINGMPISNEKTIVFDQMPYNVIEKITIYEISKHTPYGKAIDITLTIGKPARTPDFHLNESFLIN